MRGGRNRERKATGELENMRGKQRGKGRDCYELPFFLLAEIQVMIWEGGCGEWEGGGVVQARQPTVAGHRLPLIDSTRFLIPPNRDLVLPVREPELRVDDGSSAVEKPIFASLLARAIC